MPPTGSLNAIAMSAGAKGTIPGMDIFDGTVFRKVAGSSLKEFLPTNIPDRRSASSQVHTTWKPLPHSR